VGQGLARTGRFAPLLKASSTSARPRHGPGVGPWHPHMMLYTPYYENSMLGGNQVGGMLPFVGDDAGTPFAVTVIPVAHELAVKTQVR